jgi:hypothetical protein
VPAASEAATAVETTETATHMAETSDMGDTHAVGETATPKMGDCRSAPKRDPAEIRLMTLILSRKSRYYGANATTADLQRRGTNHTITEVAV